MCSSEKCLAYIQTYYKLQLYLESLGNNTDNLLK